MQLLPPQPGVCPVCAGNHAPDSPHNCQSLYYQYRFFGLRGRWPTWADAVAHCIPKLRSDWERELRARGKWSFPPDGSPIADPPAESLRQLVGDPGSHGFGPEADR